MKKYIRIILYNINEYYINIMQPYRLKKLIKEHPEFYNEYCGKIGTIYKDCMFVASEPEDIIIYK